MKPHIYYSKLYNTWACFNYHYRFIIGYGKSIEAAYSDWETNVDQTIL